jgi:hypothetical protein
MHRKRKSGKRAGLVKISCTGWQTDDPSATLVTRFYRLPLGGGYGLCTTRIYRRFPAGTLDLLHPVAIVLAPPVREEGALAQHQTIRQDLRTSALPPDIMRRLQCTGVRHVPLGPHPN